MSRNLLSERAVRTAKPKTKEYNLNDGDGLQLRIKPTGAKIWRLRLMKAGATSIQTLGHYPSVSLLQARELADARRAPAILALVKDKPKTLDDMFDLWFTKYVVAHRRRQNDRDSISGRYRKHVSPVIGRVAPGDIRSSHYMPILDDVIAAGHPRQAKLLLAETHQMFGYGTPRGWVVGDPLAGVKAKDIGGKKRRSSRVLDAEELKSLPGLFIKGKLPRRTQLGCWLALSAMARSIEVASVSAEDVDLKKGTWRVPGEFAKNGQEHLIHLNEVSKAVFGILLADRPEGWLFPGRGKRAGTYIQPTAFTRELTDRQGREKPLKGRRNTRDLALPGGHWTMHDLRRTGSTMMGELGYDKDLIDLCLNHMEEDEVKATYQLQQRIPERKRAFTELGTTLSKILGGVDFLPRL